MEERDYTDHMMQVYEALKLKRKKWKKVVQVEHIAALAKEATAQVTGVLADLNTIGALQENVENVTSLATSNVVKANEVLPTKKSTPTSTQQERSSEATSVQKGCF
ncbi:hypothetical protein JHK87_040053 [Glycine soja]|nr:hypothetical protein JHK87_040053 [Glycine soja]